MMVSIVQSHETGFLLDNIREPQLWDEKENNNLIAHCHHVGRWPFSYDRSQHAAGCY
jgi:hypothetical protein